MPEPGPGFGRELKRARPARWFEGRGGQFANAERVRADAISRASQSALVDAATAEVVGALDEQGIRSIVLKGPSIERLLYTDGAERWYDDLDLLVAPERTSAAAKVLARLGFTEWWVDPEYVQHAQPWIRDEDGVPVDLHWTLIGVGAAPTELWRALSSSTERIVVHGARVEVLAAEGIAFQVALHAGQHGAEYPQVTVDLERALELVDRSTWAAAAELARLLQATELFAGGLRLSPRGAEIAAELDLPERLTVETLLLTRSQGLEGAATLQRLARTPSLRRKLALVGRRVIPTRETMRDWWPRTRKGNFWLAVGYLWRPVWLLLQIGPAFVAWRRAVRDSRSVGGP